MALNRPGTARTVNQWLSTKRTAMYSAATPQPPPTYAPNCTYLVGKHTAGQPPVGRLGCGPQEHTLVSARPGLSGGAHQRMRVLSLSYQSLNMVCCVLY
jgi:hypothetical protein